MYLFLILLFPIALFCHLARGAKQSSITAMWASAAVSIVLCSCRAFLSFSYRVHSASFIFEWGYTLLTLTIVPIAVSCIILLVMRKCGFSIADCVIAFFCALSAFFAIALPFATLAGAHSAYSAYELFLRPSIYLMMAVSQASCAKLIAAANIDKSLHLRRVAYPVCAVFMLLPSVIDTMWLTNIKGKMYLVLWTVYMILSLLWYVVCALRTTQTAQ